MINKRVKLPGLTCLSACLSPACRTGRADRAGRQEPGASIRMRPAAAGRAKPCAVPFRLVRRSFSEGGSLVRRRVAEGGSTPLRLALRDFAGYPIRLHPRPYGRGLQRSRVKVGALACIIIGLLLLLSRTDREFKNVIPSEGEANTIIMDSTSSYELTFPADRKSLTRIGFYFSLIGRDVPRSKVTVRINQQGKQLSETSVESSFISGGGAITYFTFPRPVNIIVNKPANVSLEIPDDLSKRVGIQIRVVDETFNADDSVFTINGEVQADPIAYRALYSYVPPLPMQLGLMLIVFGLFLYIGTSEFLSYRFTISLYILSASIIYTVPGLLLGKNTFMVSFAAFIALSGMYILLRHNHLSPLASLSGAHVFAFTTWFPLHLMSGRPLYIFLSLIPFIVLLFKKGYAHSRSAAHYRPVAFALLALISIIIVLTVYTESTLSAVASPRDVFFDPNQVPPSQKIEIPPHQVLSEVSMSWDHYGSYIGVPALVLSAVGIAFGLTKYVGIGFTGIVFAFIALQPSISYVFFTLTSILPQHTVIFTTFALAYFSGIGLDRVRSFLGKEDTFVTVIMFLYAAIIFLDLYHVSASTLEYSMI